MSVVILTLSYSGINMVFFPLRGKTQFDLQGSSLEVAFLVKQAEDFTQKSASTDRMGL